MPEKIPCEVCKGEGIYEALVSQHDDKKEIVTCHKCKGKGTLNIMTDEEERDYRADYW